jgi:hypothetical protein
MPQSGRYRQISELQDSNALLYLQAFSFSIPEKAAHSPMSRFFIFLLPKILVDFLFDERVPYACGGAAQHDDHEP